MLTIVSVAAWAGPITDPSMGIDEGACSGPITASTTFGSVNGGGKVCYYNPFGHPITSLGFDVFINPGITFGQGTTPALSDVFQCNDANTSRLPNPYFLSCSVSYNSSSGELDIRFFGTRSFVVGDFAPGGQGIPPLPPDCQNNPDAERCLNAAHFLITLNDNFADGPTDPPNGGWSPDSNPALFSGPPVFQVNEIGPVPEPSTLALLSGALILAGYRMRRRR